MPNRRTEENNGFGPLYKPRGYGSLLASGFVIVVYLVCIFFLERRSLQSWNIYLFGAVFSFLAVLIGEVIRRICLFFEEYRHLNARYEGSFKKAFKVAFGFKNNGLVCGFACIAVFFSLVVIYYVRERESLNPDYARLFFLNAVFMPIMVYVVGLRDPSKVEYSQNNEGQNKNLADGLAWSFYFGYLKFVLPALKGQINETEKYRFKIDVQKLFIVIPKNCQVYDKISNKDTDPQQLIEVQDNLAPLKKNRGGIQDRVYRHTVHSIRERKPGGTDEEVTQHFCVMEYATPLMTLLDMSNDPNAGLSREERDQQVVLFTTKLKKILDEDKECRGKYELITFSGEEDQDLAKIMLDALKNSAVEIGL